MITQNKTNDLSESETEKSYMKIISWNVNGLRAATCKGFSEAFACFDTRRNWLQTGDKKGVTQNSVDMQSINLRINSFFIIIVI